MKIGIIGGSGLYQIDGLEIKEELFISTPYGNPSHSYKIGFIDKTEIVFLARHGIPHKIPPHKVNYRANIWGFKELGIERIISVNAVGGINRDLKPGDIVLPDQIIDKTFGVRESTFYDKDKVIHIDFTEPYCSEMRYCIKHSAKKNGISLKEEGVYICINGPRLETKKEIDFFSKIGADVIGMTGMPETALAREVEICLSSISIVTNYAAGISENKLTITEVVSTMATAMGKIKILIKGAIKEMPSLRNCFCKDALKDAGI